MEKVIKLGGKEVRLKSTAASLIRYKANFGRDGLKDLMSLSRGMSAGEKGAADAIQSGDLDLDVFYRFLWVFAKSGDPSIPPMEEWLDGIDAAPFDLINGAFPVVVGLLTSTTAGTVKAVKNSTAAAVI